MGQWSVFDLADLIGGLRAKLGGRVGGARGAAPGGAAGGAAGAAGAAAPAQEQTEFTGILKSGGEKKIQVIKEIRAITSLGLKEAKDLGEGAPGTVKGGVSKEEGEENKKKRRG